MRRRWAWGSYPWPWRRNCPGWSLREGNPEPAFRTDGVLLRNVRRIGENGNHLKATAVQGDSYGEVVAWGMGHRFDALLQQERCDMIYTPQRNDWNGQRLLQLRAEVLRGGEIQDPTGYLNQRTEKFVDAFSQNILYNKGCVHDVTEGLDAIWKNSGNGQTAPWPCALPSKGPNGF